MDRRLIGALLVVAVFAVAIVVPLLGGRRTTGIAEPVPIPRDPRMGDCLLHQPEGIEPTFNQPAVAERPGTANSPAAVSGPLGATVVPCQSSPVAAEVVLTVSAGGALVTRQRTVAESGIDCHAAAMRYAGLTRSAEGFRPATVSAQEAAEDVVSWQMSINVRTAWVYPSPFLRAAGRTWAACVVAPPSDGWYTGSLADAFGIGRLPDEYGTCWNSLEVSAGTAFVSCRQPHLAELISAGSAAATANTSDLQESCRRLASTTLGRSDPTADGALTIRTSPAELYVADQNRSNIVLCYLTTAGRPLSGTLMGLHEEPVPFGG